ncbi:MAG: DUF1871 domain-containing protein [Finegoldia sp.]|nr:DUF1871 domain-containing protein [Finegoldia sp.]
MSVENIINEWDPYSLFPYAPKDEYNNEIDLIENFIKTENNENKLALFLKNIFETDIIFEENKRNFLEISKKILLENKQ